METSIGKALESFANTFTVTPSEDRPPPALPPPKAPSASAACSYVMTSTKFTGSVVFQFDADGFLSRYDITEAQLSLEQKTFILQKLPRNIEGIEKVLGSSKDAKLVKQKASQVTFEQYWDKYNEKARSSKKKTLNCWNRMSQVQRDRAFNFIETYFKSIPPGIAKKYAETYLNAELWNN